MDNGKAAILIDPHKGRKDKPTYTPSDKDRRTIKAVESAGDKLRRAKIPFEKQWFVNLAALQNQYWLAWNTVTRSYEIPLRGPGEGVRLSIDHMSRFWRDTIAKITAHPPALHVAPATSDEEDIEIARLSLKVIESEFERLRFHGSIDKRLAGWQIGTGNVYAMVRWDPTLGPPMWEDRPVMSEDAFGVQTPIVDPMTGEEVTERWPVTDESGEQLHLGENVVEVFSPFECGSDPLAASLDESEWFYRETIRSLSWIRDHYPKRGPLVEAEKDLYGDSTYEKLNKQLAGAQGTTSGDGEDDAGPIQEAARVREYWERPTKAHPEGRSIVVANKVLLWDDVNPYAEQIKNGFNFPVVHIVEILVNGRTIGTSTIEKAVGLNRALNRRRSQEEENTAIVGRPKILKPKGSGIREGAFNGKAGEVIEYQPVNGMKPEPFKIDSTAMATDTAIRHLMSDIQDITFAHDPSVGRMPSANAPAEAVRLLTVGDETAKGETSGHLMNGIIRIAQLLLCNFRQFATEERLVRVTGEDQAIQAQKIVGQQLAGGGEGNYCDIRIIPGSMMWRDPESQRTMVKELVELGAINPLEHRREMLKMLDLGTLSPVMRDYQQHEAWANKENELMEQGQQLMPRDFEDQNIHILQHNRFRNSERYRRLPPEIQMIFDEHVALHEQFMVAKAQKDMAMQAAVAGAGMPPGGPGEPSPGQPGAAPGQSGAPEGATGEVIDIERDPQSGQAMRLKKSYAMPNQPGETMDIERGQDGMASRIRRSA